MTELRQLEISDPRWSSFVSKRVQATAFHQPAWAGLLAECYGFRTFALALTGEQEIEAGLPVVEISKRFPRRSRRWVSLPFTDACGPLAARSDGEAALLARRDLDRTFFDLQLETRRRLGVPVQPRRFFSLLWERVVEPGHGFLLLAYSGATPVAGAVFLEANGLVTYKYGASSQSHWRLRANALVLWAGVQHGCATGARSIDFGRTEVRHESLRAFKQQWSTSEEALRYTILGRHRERGPAGVTETAAASLIRRSPPFVCRALGELLYKHTA
jgi:CelD/BcsL family acetyltransferase involved in cellulose biosynthesis